MNNTIQDLKVKIEPIKKTQNRRILEMKILGIQMRMLRQASPTQYKKCKKESKALKT